MNAIPIKEILIISVAVAIAACLLTPHKPVSLPNLAPDQHSYEWSRAPGKQIGARNHPGIERYDLFDFRRSRGEGR
jgi:hypothetical protein